MSRKFNRIVRLSEVDIPSFSNVDGLDAIQVESISDNTNTSENSIAVYIKGPLPSNKENLQLLTSTIVPGYCCIIVDNPRVAMNEFIAFIALKVGFTQDYTDSILPSSVKIGKNVVIEHNVEIGEGTIIEHNVVIHSGTRIGRNCLIRTHSSIGGGGYNYIKDNQYLVKQIDLGGVWLGDNVEIGSNTCVVRGLVDDTVIMNNVKVDNLVHIAHDCFIDEDAYIIAKSELSGYVKIGKRTRIAPGSCIKQRLTIGDDVIVGLGSIVLKNVSSGCTVFGSPARKIN
ncbi:hypothetical protein BEL05_19085 [Shewanella colwelliana]|uniref:UDP-3-O-(3-hydroxymyristoyl)glucosamine N-acyltransferase n=1 Tax=Shewanella colwelliana TaxID=23 RepID=A0A1E5IVG6_SHECO|nr:UDP-3-O-(3-hydroxymyristoyl)glucosamine N-acyltransferase [Shewanella colwelliana]OEG74540.1 hypothetical protein BEL05_19085 [Shewanella colwelliana]